MLSLRKWRQQRLHDETLPSGLPVLLRDVDLASIFIDGHIPNTLIDLAISGELQNMTEEEAGKKLLEGDTGDFNMLLRQVVKAALVEPAIGEKADDLHILFEELSFEDKMFIFNFANREADQIRPFREGETEPGDVA
jgi:hypothetical protein